MAKSDSFVHLHVHTDFSRLDGMETVSEVAQFAARDGQPAAAITDHGTMSGYIKFEKACYDNGIKPIPGIEAYHVDSFERVMADKDRSRDHMLLLAVSDEGYRNLMRSSSIAHLEQNYFKPLFDDALLERHKSGLVMTSGCLGSPVNQALLAGDESRAKALLAKYRDMMEPGHYFVEVQAHDFEEQVRVNKRLIPIAKDMGIPLLAGQDAHYASPMRAIAHERMLAMQTGAALSDKTINEGGSRFAFASHTNFLATAAEMRRRVPDDLYPGACDNTLLVAEMASDITRQAGSKYLIPSFPDAEQHGGERAMLRTLVVEGAKKKYGEHYGGDVAERIDYELGVIHDMGFDAYFLIVWDLVRWAKDQGIYVGPGRGSAAGSIVSYALDITTIDPIRYHLYFERFLNPGRKSMPDIDIDFERDRRAEVRNYLREKYGHDHVSYIATSGTFHGRSAIKAAARIYEVPAGAAQEVSSTFPNKTKLTIRQMSGDRAALPKRGDREKDDETTRDWDEGADFRKAIRKGGNLLADVVDAAADVEGYIQNFGKHAAGVLITPKPLTEFVPVTRETKDGDDLGTCGYDKDDVESIGGLKMDLLGLVNLTTIRKAVEQIKETTGKHLDVNSLPLDDAKTFALLQRADTDGVFQLGSSGMKELLRRAWPTQFEDLSALVALYRPGPMGTDMHWSYADRKNGRERIVVEHDDMLLFTEDTHGLVVYQEQMLTLAQHFAGFTAGEADTLRKATGKKDAELLAAQETKFKQGMARQGYDQRLADKLWAKLPSFAAYSFNKSHSAAYALVAYQTAYLKANFPSEYAAACVDTLSDPAVQMQWAKAAGVTFQVPDVNESSIGARAFGGKVRLGLSGIKGLGEASCSALIEERNERGPYASLSDFMVRVATTKKVNKVAIEALIEAGALDSLSTSRGEMRRRLPALLDGAKAAVPKSAGEWDDDSGLFGEVEAPTLVLDFDEAAPESMPLSERIGCQVKRLGVFLGEHPLDLFESSLMDRIPAVSEAISPDVALGGVTVHGVVSGVETKKTRRSILTTATLEASDGYSLDVKFFDPANDVVEAGLGSLVVVEGVLQEDEWRKAALAAERSGDDEGDIADEGESPRELLAQSWMVIPLSALNDVSTNHDRHNITVTIDDEAVMGKVASALVGSLSPGLRMISIVTPDGVTPLPQLVAETSDDVARLLRGIEGVLVARA